MRVFIGCEDIASIVTGLSTGFQDLGHQVTTLVKTRNQFYSHAYTYNADVLPRLISRTRFQKFPLGEKVYDVTAKVARRAYLRSILPKLIREHDLFIFVWNSILPDSSDLSLLKRNNKRIITLFAGSDVRDPIAFQQEFRTDVSKWDEIYFDNFNRKLQWLRMNELYSDAIFSVPDQAGLALRPYNHFFLPFSSKGYQFKISDNKTLRVLHAPSKKGIKGTDKIIGTLEQLKAEGLDIEITLLSGVPHEVLKQKLAESDVLVDELVLHGPGMLSLEAMASGCAVATRYMEKYSDIFAPPICNIDDQNIYQQLKKLFTDRDYRLSLSHAGKEFVKNNEASTIASQLLRKIESASKADYFPEFYLKDYQLPKGTVIQEKNLELTRQVIEKYGVPQTTDLTSAVKRGLIKPLTGTPDIRRW